MTFPAGLLEVQYEGKHLTLREREILRLLARGYTTKEVAERLGKSHETIRTQVKIARAKLNAKTIAHAIAVAVSLDMI